MLLQQNVEKERAQSLEDANKAGSAVAAAVTKLETTDIVLFSKFFIHLVRIKSKLEY